MRDDGGEWTGPGRSMRADGLDQRLVAAGRLEASECPDVGSQSLGKRGHTYCEA